MSATADKARYFLEQSVPELKELERKKIFTPQEITAIARKRSDFEHKINARGSAPSDYAKYAEYEINIDQLRKKRVKRLGVKTTGYNGQRRIFFVFDRGMRKFPGDLNLWMQAIEYARSQKALKKVTQILTNALRLHPTKSQLWIYAARFALEENGDMTEARGYMQRGLRFCKTQKDIWLQNCRLELTWIAKIHARRRILGIEAESANNEVVKVVGEDDDMMMLPQVTAHDIAPVDDSTDSVDLSTLDSLATSSAMTGAIPIAIVDVATKQFPGDTAFAWALCEVTLDFDHEIPAVRNVLSHLDHLLQDLDPTSSHAYASQITMAVFGTETSSPSFPAKLRSALALMTDGLSKTTQRQPLVIWSISFLKRLLSSELDPALSMVLQSKLQSLA